jgi:superfamily II DNA or RNA helicase
MAYGLSNVEFSPREQLDVGSRDGWHLSVSDEGIYLQPEQKSGLLGSRPEPSEHLRTRLKALAGQGFCTEKGGAYYFTFSDLKSLRVEDRGVLHDFCGWFPCMVQLNHSRNLGHPEFRIRVEFLVGGAQAHPEIVGPFARFEGTFYLLSDQTRTLLDEVATLNALPPDQKTALPQVLKSWGAVDAAADEADASLDPYLRGEQVVVPEKVSLDVHEHEDGEVSIVPTFAGVGSGAMHKVYLREDEINEVYNTETENGGRVRVVLNEEVRGALVAVSRYRRLSQKDRDRLFSRPNELLPDGVDPDVVDLSLYGPRVRAIGEYAATVRLLGGSERAWIEPETEGSPAQEELPSGLDLQFSDGAVEHEVFEDVSEVEQLIEAVDSALAKGEPVVKFRGKRLPVSPDLRGVLEQCRAQMNRRRRSEEPPLGEEPETPKNKSKIQGPLVYENISEREFGESEHPHEGKHRFQRPSALLPSVVLKKHQEVGVGWLADTVLSGRRGVLLADDMGLGKTLQALTFLAWLIEHDALKSGISCPKGPWEPVLVVCPPILLEVWREEIEKFFDRRVFLPYAILDSAALRKLRVGTGREGRDKDGQLVKSVLNLDEIRQHRLILTDYHAVANYSFSFAQMKWTAVVSDESHQFKEPSTGRSHVMKSLNTRFRLAMTGTPVVNRLLDVWNLVDFLSPLLLGSQKEFRKQYELPDEQGGSAEGARRLKEKLHVSTGPPVTAKSVVLRRSKANELPGLPKKIDEVLLCPISADQRTAYNNLKQAVRSQGGRGKMLGLLARLNQLLQHPALAGGLLPMDSSKEELVTASTKLQALLAQLRQVREKGEKALVFASYIDMQTILKRVIDSEFSLNTRVINGKASGSGQRVRTARQATIEEFCNSDGFNVMILSPDVAGVGLTITAANHVFHYGRWWNPAREDQATDRTHRIGQERDVFVYRLVATDPDHDSKIFDEHLDDLISERRNTAEQFLTPSPEPGQMGHQLVGRVFDQGQDAEQGPAKPIDCAEELEVLSPYQFESLVACWLAAEGKEAFVTPRAADDELDVVAVSDEEIWCVQVKHTSKRRYRVDEKAADEARVGATHYQANTFPRSLGNRRLKLAVVTNGRASARLKAEARRTGVEVIAGGTLLRALRKAPVTLSDVYLREAQRCSSMRDLKALLAKRFS